MTRVARHCFIRGRVQGVGFRRHSERIARSFAVSGFVQNLDDGRVEMHIEAEPDEIKRFLTAIHKYFESHIEGIEEREGALLNLVGFKVRN